MTLAAVGYASNIPQFSLLGSPAKQRLNKMIRNVVVLDRLAQAVLSMSKKIGDHSTSVSKFHQLLVRWNGSSSFRINARDAFACFQTLPGPPLVGTGCLQLS